MVLCAAFNVSRLPSGAQVEDFCLSTWHTRARCWNLECTTGDHVGTSVLLSVQGQSYRDTTSTWRACNNTLCSSPRSRVKLPRWRLWTASA